MAVSFPPRTAIFLSLISLVFLALFLSTPTLLVDAYSGSTDREWRSRILRRQHVPDAIPLRILAIGDSITQGHMSTDGNGYRLDLRNELINSGSDDVDFIGTQSSGVNNPDNQEEGYGGQNISHITEHVQTDGILFQHPNIVLIHAGTNDLDVNSPPPQPYATAPDRLGTLIDVVLCECPDAVVLVAQLIGDRFSADTGELTSVFNAAVPGVVAARLARGYKVVVVNQSGINGSNLIDGLHPTDFGYAMMALNWFVAIESLPERWVTVPRAPVNSSAEVNLAFCSAAPSPSMSPSTATTATEADQAQSTSSSSSDQDTTTFSNIGSSSTTATSPSAAAITSTYQDAGSILSSSGSTSPAPTVFPSSTLGDLPVASLTTPAALASTAHESTDGTATPSPTPHNAAHTDYCAASSMVSLAVLVLVLTMLSCV